MHRYRSLAVLTAYFIITPMQPVTIYEFSQFLRERSYAMMFFLIRDVSRYRVQIGM